MSSKSPVHQTPEAEAPGGIAVFLPRHMDAPAPWKPPSQVPPPQNFSSWPSVDNATREAYR